MPNRILREGINSSPRVDCLSDGAEILYRRLISVVDDYGRYYASPGTLRGACWPLRPERVTEAEVRMWVEECVKVGLVFLYGNGRFLQMADFRQQVRSKSKFPEPDINCVANAKQLLITSRSRISESKTETQQQSAADAVAVPECQHDYPLTLSMIRERSPSTDERFVIGLVNATVQHLLSHPKFPQDRIEAATTDAVMARACQESFATGPKDHRAGLLLTTVPRIITTWGTEKKYA